jgi:hypothetical protein
MNDEDFKITRKYFPDEEDFELLRKKGSVPYLFYTYHKSFKETELRKDMFDNDLKNEFEPDEVYESAKKLWEHFEIENHREFIDLYLQSDVLLLADCFERFREVNMKHLKIDPCHCYSAPGLTWQAGLKYTDIRLELITESDILLSIEKCIRGGISGVKGTRYYSTDENHKLLYVDTNNLYSWAMMEPQPYGEFEIEDGSGLKAKHIIKN